MKVLVVCDSHPLPPDDGMRLHLAGLLPPLSDEHEVSLITLVTPGDETDPASIAALGVAHWQGVRARPGGLLRRLAVELPALLHRRPVLVQQARTSGLAEALVEQVARDRPDVVHLQPGWVAGLADLLDGIPVVAVPLDAAEPNLRALRDAATGLRRRLAQRELRRMVAFERRQYSRVAGVVVVSDPDARLLRAQNAQVDPIVVPNGVDLGRWSRPPGSVREPDLVVMSGAMSYPPNVDAAQFAATEILPRLRARRPGVRLALVGRDPAPEVLALAGEGVEVTGTVPEIGPWLWRAGAYLCPMRTGTGIKNKLLEALAAGCPVVATPFATGGIEVVAECDLLLADDADGLAAALDRVLSEPETADRLSRAAAGLAATQSWARTARQFTQVYERAVPARS